MKHVLTAVFLLTIVLPRNSVAIAEPNPVAQVIPLASLMVVQEENIDQPVQEEDEVGAIEYSLGSCPQSQDVMEDPVHTTISFFNRALNLGQYIPQGLVSVDPHYTDGGREVCLEAQTYAAFVAMNNALSQDQAGSLFIRSGFRTHELQEIVKEKHGIYAAPAGRSEHQLGNAVDLIGTNTSQKFGDSSEYQWMKQYAASYGFVESFQEEFEDINHTPAEAWHWRYVGVALATKIKESASFDPNEYLFYSVAQTTPQWDTVETLSQRASTGDILY